MNFVKDNDVYLIVKSCNKINTFHENANRPDFQFIKFTIYNQSFDKNILAEFFIFI